MFVVCSSVVCACIIEDSRLGRSDSFVFQEDSRRVRHDKAYHGAYWVEYLIRTTS
jgi:hypothetical protein